MAARKTTKAETRRTASRERVGRAPVATPDDDELTPEEEAELAAFDPEGEAAKVAALTAVPAVERQDDSDDEPLLTLRAYVPKRRRVRVVDAAGKAHVFEMRMLREFSSVRRQRIINIWDDILRIMDKAAHEDQSDPNYEEITDEEDDLVRDGYARVIRAAFPEMPAWLFAQLADQEREALASYFFRVTGEEAERASRVRAAQTSRSTGANSSRVSNGSTARATRRPGSSSTRNSSTRT